MIKEGFNLQACKLFIGLIPGSNGKVFPDPGSLRPPAQELRRHRFDARHDELELPRRYSTQAGRKGCVSSLTTNFATPK